MSFEMNEEFVRCFCQWGPEIERAQSFSRKES